MSDGYSETKLNMETSKESEPEGQGAPVTPTIPVPVPSPSVVPNPAPEPPREKMIETAVKFLLNPQVRSSPLSQKKAFLQKKGLTEEEIEMAIVRSGTREDVPKPVQQAPVAPPPQGQVAMAPYPGAPPQQMAPYMQPPPPSRPTTWRDYAAVAVIISGVSFAIYKLFMKFISPWLKRRKEENERMIRIEASIKELNENVSQTVQSLEKTVGAIQALLEKQENQLGSINSEILSSKALANSRRSTDTTEIKAEITSLKGLLLNRHQFPSTPQRTQIPAWQRGNDQLTTPKTNSLPTSTSLETVTENTVTDTKMSTAPAETINDLTNNGTVLNGNLASHSNGAAPSTPPEQDAVTDNGAPTPAPTRTNEDGMTPKIEVSQSSKAQLNGSIDVKSIEMQPAQVVNGD